MKILTYNVHSCRGTDGRLDLERIAHVISQLNPDVACLQELDVSRPRSKHIHQAGAIADLLQMEFHFHPALSVADEQYGDAILSKFPLRLIRAGALPHVPSTSLTETRGALWASISCNGTEWQVINTHFGLGRTERLVQARTLAREWIHDALRKKPVLMCGDLNSRPASRVHRVLRENLKDAQLAVSLRHRKTFATKLPFICLDYIFCTHDVEVVDCSVPQSPLIRRASDHFPLIAELNVHA